MIEWDETHLAIRDAVRRFIVAEIKPKLEALEHGDATPYDLLRKFLRTFGLDELARARLTAELARERADSRETKRERKPSPEAGNELAMQLISIIELCHYSPGLVTAMGASIGLTGRAILSR